MFTILLIACQQATETSLPATAIATAKPSVVPELSTDTMTPSPIPPTVAAATSTPTATPLPPTEKAVATLVPTPVPTRHPLHEFTIEGMRERLFAGGQITMLTVLEETDAYTRTYISYPSDGLTITGVMHLPTGEGAFPVVILLHGYADRDQYFAGWGTWQAADYFARRGYIVIAPDYRSWGESDSGLSLFHMGLVADVLNLIGSISSVPQADSGRIGLWGHSMGGGIATKILTIDERVKAAVLYAPNSGDDADLIARWGLGCLAGESQNDGDHCDPAEVIPAGSSPELVAAYRQAGADPFFLREVAPLYHLDAIGVPVQIHIGSADGGPLAATPPDWSDKLANALVKHGHEVDYFVYEGQGHFFAGESWTMFLNRALEFYDQELKSSSEE